MKNRTAFARLIEVGRAISQSLDDRRMYAIVVAVPGLIVESHRDHVTEPATGTFTVFIPEMNISNPNQPSLWYATFDQPDPTKPLFINVPVVVSWNGEQGRFKFLTVSSG